jgi:hypothetical protein
MHLKNTWFSAAYSIISAKNIAFKRSDYLSKIAAYDDIFREEIRQSAPCRP